ncbi:hypothetical protein ACFY8N_20900, partial [Streptomyces collinus]|uniref:hypothetical protein n=1 Tax=Streptomyces collinus TaxID=42684 RepID=UPI00368DC6FB
PSRAPPGRGPPPGAPPGGAPAGGPAPAPPGAGAHDLRTYTFLPWTSLPHPTPGISHDNPTFRRYHGCVALGADNRATMAETLASKQVADLVADQHTVMTAVHAFTVEHTEPVIRTGPLVRP